VEEKWKSRRAGEGAFIWVEGGTSPDSALKFVVGESEGKQSEGAVGDHDGEVGNRQCAPAPHGRSARSHMSCEASTTPSLRIAKDDLSDNI
jgi:hypothetical protein